VSETAWEWCPTQAGTIQAYEPLFKFKGEKKWRTVPTEIFPGNIPNGVPTPLRKEVAVVVGLMGFAQANALAWRYAAFAEAEGKIIQVKVQRYEVVYDIKARKVK
jgi:hypothetical protein